MLADPSLVATNESYFRKSTGRTEAKILTEKIIAPKNLRGTSVTCRHENHLFGVTKAFSLLFGSAKCFVADSWTGESDTEKRRNMRLFKRRLLEIH